MGSCHQTVLIKMIANALIKQTSCFIPSSLRNLSQFRRLPSRADVPIERFLIFNSANRKRNNMICMRRGLWGTVSRQNQTDSRGNVNFGKNVSQSQSQSQESVQDQAEVVSSSSSSSWPCSSLTGITDDPMPAAGELETISPASKRVKLDVQEDEMPTATKSVQISPEDPPSLVLRWKKLTENATAPKKGSDFAAGFDLYSASEYTIPAQGKETIMTDIQIQLPEGCYGRVAPRSGLARNHFIDVGAGVIDRDYRGNVGVVMFNHGKEDYKVEKATRVAQLICERIFYPKLEEALELGETKRGSGGYGSTGTN